MKKRSRKKLKTLPPSIKTLSSNVLRSVYRPFYELCGEYQAGIFNNPKEDDLAVTKSSNLMESAKSILPNIIIIPDETIKSEEPFFEVVKTFMDGRTVKTLLTVEEVKRSISNHRTLFGYRKIIPLIEVNESTDFDFIKWLER